MDSEDNWVSREAKRRAVILRDGPEVWRNLRLAVESDVKSWIGIYNPSGQAEVQFVQCQPITEDCLRVRIIPATGRRESYLEARFDALAGNVTVTPAKFAAVFELKVQLDHSLRFIVRGKPDGLLSPQDVSQAILEPFLDTLGTRRPLVDML